MQRMYNCLPISSALWQEWMSLNCKILTKMWFIVNQNVIHSEQDQWHCIFSEPRVLEIWCCTLRIYPIEDSLHCTLTLKNWNILLSFSSIAIFHIFHAQSCFDWKCWRKTLFDAIQSGSMSCEKCGTADASRPCNVSLPAFWQISIQSQTSILTNIFPNKYIFLLHSSSMVIYTLWSFYVTRRIYSLLSSNPGSRQSWQPPGFWEVLIHQPLP